MKEKILFFTYAPFDPEVHITDQILEDLPITKVIAVKEIVITKAMTDENSYKGVKHIINTTRAELVRSKDATQEEKRFASDYIEVISREGSERKVWQYDLACAFMAEYYKHVYIVDALIDD